MSQLKKKLLTAKRFYLEHGTKGLAQLCLYKIGVTGLFAFCCTKVNWCLGRLVELRGNVVSVDGCVYSVDSPAIATDVKRYFLFNHYEKPEREALKQFLDPDLPVIELGCALGVIACLTNKMLHQPGNHVVVEANPDLLKVLEENRARNDCRFTILHRAVAYGSPEVLFHQGDNFLGNSVQVPGGQPVKVTTTCLQEIIENYGFENCTLICDIEGGERDLISNESELLREKVKTLIIEIHDWILSPLERERLNRHLKETGFVLVKKQKANFVFVNQGLQ